MKKSLITTLVILALSSAAFADWFPGQPAKWVQLPDLNPTGMDVYSSLPIRLADDFLCTSTELITDIHVWGSWLNDWLPGTVDATGAYVPDPTAVGFRIGIHSDIPADPTNPDSYSRPGDLLWQYGVAPGTVVTNLYADNIQEGWYDPSDETYIPIGDHQAWQYNFFIDPADAFLQKGTPVDPIVYWLSVEANPLSVPGVVPAQFGWKTSIDHWNDDAVWMNSNAVPAGPWQELRYPSAHPYAGDSVDLAFVITPEPATMVLLALGGLSVLNRKRRS